MFENNLKLNSYMLVRVMVINGQWIIKKSNDNGYLSISVEPFFSEQNIQLF